MDDYRSKESMEKEIQRELKMYESIRELEKRKGNKTIPFKDKLELSYISGIKDLKNKACVVYNCKPARDLLESKRGMTIGQYIFTGSWYGKTLENLKMFEKDIGIGVYLSPKAMCAATFYITARQIGIYFTQKKVCRLFNTGASTLRKYKNMILEQCDAE